MLTIQILTLPKSWYLFRCWERSAGECLERLVQLKKICITKRISSSRNKITSWHILISWLQDSLERNYSIGLDVAVIKTHFSFKSNVKLSKKNKMHKHYECWAKRTGIIMNDKLNYTSCKKGTGASCKRSQVFISCTCHW